MPAASVIGTLGAPGIRVGAPEPIHAITGVRRDVTAFLGVAPRGPARLPPPPVEPDVDIALWLQTALPRRSIPVAVTSWDEYRGTFGGFEGRGRLPYAVSTFFANGGEIAYVVRVVHDYGDPALDDAARASFPLGSLESASGVPVRLLGRYEGSWGNRLTSRLTFATRPVTIIEASTTEVVVDRSEWIPLGSLIRVRQPGGTTATRFVDDSREEPNPVGAGRRRRLVLASAVPTAPAAPEPLDVITASLETTDLDPLFARREVLTNVGLRADHPRALARVIVNESKLVWPDPAWAGDALAVADPALRPIEGSLGTVRMGSLATSDGTPMRFVAAGVHTWDTVSRIALDFDARVFPVLASTTTVVETDAAADVPVGSLVRVELGGGERVLRYVDDAQVAPDGGGSRLHLTLSAALLSPAVAVEVITLHLELGDRDVTAARAEVHDGLGARFDHPRWIGATLATVSLLLRGDPSWATGTLSITDPTLPPVVVTLTESPGMRSVADRWADITPDDFFDPRWVPGDEVSGAGVQCLAECEDVGLVCVPDLYEPMPIAPIDDVDDPPSLCGPDFEPHVDTPPPQPREPPPPGLDGLALDPSLPAELAEIVRHQRALVDFADQRRDLTVLLDVPPALSQREIMEWRNSFASTYAAAYHPWIDVATPDDARDSLIRINPSAFAAGIVAARERRLGVQHGPANELAVSAIRPASVVTPEQHDALHPAGINVFTLERDGVRLSGARTLSRDAQVRQLSVARLMIVLRLSLEREMTWAVFEPSNARLWAEVRRTVHAYLSRLFAANAFRGATTREAFFVRCDRTTMSTNDLDNGRMICLVGVAPAEPTEYLLLEITRDRDDSVRVELAGV